MKKLFLFYFLSTGFYINAQEQVTFYFDFNEKLSSQIIIVHCQQGPRKLVLKRKSRS